jgi:hypothetical protein
MNIKLFSNLKEIVYITDINESTYTFENIIELAKGNLKYAELLLERANGYCIETLILDDLIEGEIVEFNDQYILTGGVEIEIREI